MRVGGQHHAPGRFTPGKQPRHPFYRRLGGIPEPIRTDMEKRKSLDPTGFQNPDRPAGRRQIYELRYPAPIQYEIITIKYDKSSGEHSCVGY